MFTLQSEQVSNEDLDAMTSASNTLPADSAARDFLGQVVDALHLGKDIKLVAEEEQLSPASVAKLIGVSRAHVYKLMDRGEIAFRRVGTERRTSPSDVRVFLDRQQAHREQFAWRVAHPSQVRESARSSLANPQG